MIKQFNRDEIGDVLQKIYDARINIKIHWIADGGIDWEMEGENGPVKVNELEASISNNEWGKIEYSISALAYEIYRLYPQSDFAKWYVSLTASTPSRKNRVLE